MPQPFAWACRERLRKLCAGKRVKFVVVRPGQANRPESCDVTMQDGTNLALTLVQEGLAKLRPGRAEDKRSAYFTQLHEAPANAQAAMLGQWNTAPGTAAAAVRDVKVRCGLVAVAGGSACAWLCTTLGGAWAVVRCSVL